MESMKHHKLFWQSSYDRGLDILLSMWPEIIKRYPDATLDISYGWDLFDKAYGNNRERLAWKEKVQELMQQNGITHHGRIGQDQLQKIRSKCGIWAYPTYFTEIFCITAVEAQHDGLVPVTTTLAALPETAKHGILIDGDINHMETKEKFLQELINLMGDKKTWKKLSTKCKKFARRFYWEKQSSKWIDVFIDKPQLSTKVTCYTPTIRDGWWNIMASNLSKQSYPIHEWVIVDGQEESREKIANKYAKKYNLNINYIHQGKTKHKHGLSNANNIAIKEATGDLFVFLQDFVLLPENAISEHVRVSNQHPGDFIASTDMYFSMVKPNKDNTEDWFDGREDVVGELTRTNIRNQKKGIRLAEQLTDFEQNYGAVPLATLKHLNGYWEFFDDGLGWDDTEIVYRAQKLGYNVWIDDTNQCICLEHAIDEGRNIDLNKHTFKWLYDQTEKGELPIIRDASIDKTINIKEKLRE